MLELFCVHSVLGLFLTAAIPPGFGMLVERDFISSVTNIDSFGILWLLILLVTSLVSLTYDGISFIISRITVNRGRGSVSG